MLNDEVQGVAQQIIDQELEDLDDIPGLFHTSSLRERTDPELQPVAKETYELKKWYDGDNNQMYNQYQVVGQLGQGAFGAVIKGKSSDGEFALKICSTMGLQKKRFFAPDGQFASNLDILYNELNILKRINHKNIARCHEIMYGNDRIITVNQLGNLGQIMNWDQLHCRYYRNPKVVQYISKKYGTDDLGSITRIIFLQICEGVKYMHQNGISNRDIKVDNILCRQSPNLGDQIKIVDFTTVRYKKNDDISYFPAGTPGFRGPEHQFAGSQGYSSFATDVWGVGYSMFVFFHEFIPFYGESEFECDLKAKNEQLEFSQQCPQVLKDCISKMTRKDWKQRIKIIQAIDILQGA